ncbi:MAG: GTP-binding protein [Methanimicrococcus sp.]|nr:GTP-binding protein [Methanimicrococcus sp.]
MKVLLFGGFLGSGKTTTIIKLINKLTADGKKVALIINEAGEIAIDAATLEAAGISSKELTNGCICCTLAINLKTAVTEIFRLQNPDVLILESPGLALPNQVRDEILNIDVMMSFAPVVTLIDASRFTVGISQILNFTENQLKEAEIIGINKTDLVSEEKIKSIESHLKEKYPDVYTVRMSAASEDAAIDQIYELIMRGGEETVSRIDMSGGQKPKVTEKINSIEISNVTNFSGGYIISGELTVKSAGALLENIASAIGAEISKINPSFAGHIKMAITVGDMFVKVSQTAGSAGRKIETETEHIRQEKVEKNGCELCFSISATNVKKEKIEEITAQAMSVFLAAKKLAFEKQI